MSKRKKLLVGLLMTIPIFISAAPAQATPKHTTQTEQNQTQQESQKPQQRQKSVQPRDQSYSKSEDSFRVDYKTPETVLTNLERGLSSYQNILDEE